MEGEKISLENLLPVPTRNGDHSGCGSSEDLPIQLELQMRLHVTANNSA